MLPVEPFNLEKLRIANADVRFKGQRILTESVPIDDMTAHVLLKDGILKLTPLNFRLAGGELASVIEMDGRQQVIKTRSDIKVKDLHLEKLFPDFKLNKANSGVLGGRAKLESTGK